MNTVFEEKREEAMSWWNGLASAEKTRICDLNTETLGIRRHETLTGREIQQLHVKIIKS